MKKTMCVFIVLMMLMPAQAVCEIDLSGMSYEELVELKDRINIAIWQNNEWQEVEVPKGVYKVGEDIPAGKWTIKAADGITAHIYWGDALGESGVELSYSGRIWEAERVYSTQYRYYQKGDATEVSWELKEGHFFIVEDGVALFTPYAGKPSLGFK